MSKRTALRKEQPEIVQKAIAEDDKKLLSMLGKKGATQANDNREARKAFDAHLAEKRSASDEQLRIERNEHIVPLNPDDERDVV